MKSNNPPRTIPKELEPLRLIDGRAAAAVGSMSLRQWQAEVSAGRAPQPAIREPRFSRWTVASVREYWANRIQRAAAAAAQQQSDS